MPKFRKKPVVIEAIQLTWNNWAEIVQFANVGLLANNQPEGVYVDKNGKMVPDNDSRSDGRIGLAIPTLEGLMIAVEGDWIIKGVKGEFYPCKPNIFELTYEPVSE